MCEFSLSIYLSLYDLVVFAFLLNWSYLSSICQLIQRDPAKNNVITNICLFYLTVATLLNLLTEFWYATAIFYIILLHHFPTFGTFCYFLFRIFKVSLSLAYEDCFSIRRKISCGDYLLLLSFLYPDISFIIFWP